VSTHVSLAEAIRNVRQDRILDVIGLTYDALARFMPDPRIAVAGLNPHGGEGGAFGSEDAAEIAPAVERARRSGFSVDGPVAPDTVFVRAVGGAYDAVVCMYHDQGHIPMKLLDFHGSVNVTLGLPFVRTSVDHGTAFDIAWTGTASTQSFVAAFHYAAKLLGQGGESR
jgi:4-hydroxythreonine-4-phosphate dehydrogenase